MKNTVPIKKLGDVARFIRGITFKPDDTVPLNSPDAVVCMRTKNVQKDLDQTDLIAVSPHFIKRDEQWLGEGDVLVSSANSWELVGKCCWVPDLPFTATAGGFISILRSEGVFPRYLYHWMASGKTQHELRHCGRQTTNISNLSYERALELEIPLPPLPEQKRIAAILDKADAIRRKRARALKLADEFLKSVFLDMFGDPVTNPKGWPIAKFAEVGELDRGRSRHRPRNAPELLGGQYPLIQTGDVANADGYIRNYTQTYSEKGLHQSKMWPAGTLCITIAANIAKTAILTFDACFPDSIVGFKPNGLVRTEYVQYWQSFLHNILEDSAPESAQKNINLAILRKLDIPVPPAKDQDVFLQMITNTLRIKNTDCKGRSLCRELFGSLAQSAFRGDL